ncbi:MAG: OmpA family protein [Candidatus Kapabacteria bacterium]|nr:OmpA family protein [Candidatus Kapabacteria bacterium]
MKTLFLFLTISAAFLISYEELFSNDLELTREFNLITSKNASGYLKPLFTTIGEGLNTSLYNTAYQSNGWSFGINFSISGMIIPGSHLSYDAELPDLYSDSTRVRTAQLKNGKIIENLYGSVTEPTLYGSQSYAVFAAPQNTFPPDSFYKSVGFLEGNDIGLMPALPIAQLYLGMPTRTELRFRFLTFPMQGAFLTYFTIGINQNIDKLFEINKADDPFSFGITAAYHSMSRDRGINLSSLGLGLNASNKFGENLTVYGGILYENLQGNILLIRKDFNPDDVLKSPYTEIRQGKDLDIKIESFNSFRITAGAGYDWSVFRFHGDISYAAQPVLNFGVSVKILEHVEETYQPEYHEIKQPEPPKPEQIVRNIPWKYEPQTLPVERIKEKERQFDIFLEMNAINEGVENKLDTITVEEFESRQTRAILPYIFFEENQSLIPDKYHKISSVESEKFAFSALSGKSSLESYYDVLNVIGLRMKQKQYSTLTLTGTNSNIGKERNNKSLSAKRAENVKSYLINTWGIDKSRIKIESRNLPKIPSSNRDVDGQEENRRVEITSNDLDVISPVFIIDTLLRVYPDAVKYLPSVNSDAGLSSWSINSSVNGNRLKSFAGRDSIDNNQIWSLGSEGIKKKQLTGSLTTKFTAIDKENNKREVNLNHPIKVISVKNKRLNATKDTSLNVYNLILFDFNKSELSDNNKRITDFIKSELTNDTEVIIKGFTDRIGEESYNRTLSTSRAESAGSALGGHPYKSEGMGESQLIYDNDLPEGRFYSRTVIVEAKVPIN